MSLKQKQKQEYLNQKKITILGSEEDLRTWIYKLEDSGLIVRETVINSGHKDGNIVEIIQITDLHINYCNEDDMKDEELAYTYQCRKWFADGGSIPAVQKVMEYAQNFDQTMVTGDTLDYLSQGAIELMYRHVWDKDPQALIALGGHDQLKQMQTGIKDKTPLEMRREVLQKNWKHDITYASKVLKDKVIVIALDNSNHKYVEEQATKLEADIQLAREKGYIILIFQHEPISTGNPEDTQFECIRKHDAKYFNFYDKCIGNDARDDKVTRRVYDMITGNADVIKGLFCGHLHSSYYSEVKGSFIDKNGIRRECAIPQPVLVSPVYDRCSGHVMKITVI